MTCDLISHWGLRFPRGSSIPMGEAPRVREAHRCLILILRAVFTTLLTGLQVAKPSNLTLEKPRDSLSSSVGMASQHPFRHSQGDSEGQPRWRTTCQRGGVTLEPSNWTRLARLSRAQRLARRLVFWPSAHIKSLVSSSCEVLQTDLPCVASRAQSPTCHTGVLCPKMQQKEENLLWTRCSFPQESGPKEENTQFPRRLTSVPGSSWCLPGSIACHKCSWEWKSWAPVLSILTRARASVKGRAVVPSMLGREKPKTCGQTAARAKARAPSCKILFHLM